MTANQGDHLLLSLTIKSLYSETFKDVFLQRGVQRGILFDCTQSHNLTILKVSPEILLATVLLLDVLITWWWEMRKEDYTGGNYFQMAVQLVVQEY